jgi:hypothetical protein
VKSLLVKLTLAVFLAGLLAGCASAPYAPPANQDAGHIVQGGSFTGEGMIYFPLPFPDDKK